MENSKIRIVETGITERLAIMRKHLEELKEDIDIIRSIADSVNDRDAVNYTYDMDYALNDVETILEWME